MATKKKTFKAEFPRICPLYSCGILPLLMENACKKRISAGGLAAEAYL
jgi:hypothetical protein